MIIGSPASVVRRGSCAVRRRSCVVRRELCVVNNCFKGQLA